MFSTRFWPPWYMTKSFVVFHIISPQYVMCWFYSASRMFFSFLVFSRYQLFWYLEFILYSELQISVEFLNFVKWMSFIRFIKFGSLSFRVFFCLICFSVRLQSLVCLTFRYGPTSPQSLGFLNAFLSVICHSWFAIRFIEFSVFSMMNYNSCFKFLSEL